jgi:hypothetical protein
MATIACYSCGGDRYGQLHSIFAQAAFKPVAGANTSPQKPCPSLRAKRSNPESAPWTLDCFVGCASSQWRVKDFEDWYNAYLALLKRMSR